MDYLRPTHYPTMTEDKFNCKKCESPLKLDESFYKATNAQLNLLMNRSSNASNDSKELIRDLNPNEYIPEDRLELFNEIYDPKVRPIHNLLESEDEDEDGEGSENSTFVVLSEEASILKNEDTPRNTSEQSSPGYDNEDLFQRSARLKALNRIFVILSNNQDIEHPLSAECAELLIENYKLKFDQSQKEKDQYLSFLKKLKDREGVVENDGLDLKLKESVDECKRLSLVEEEKLKELKQLEVTSIDLKSQLTNYQQELADLKENELTDILKLKNKLQLELQRKYSKLEQSKSAYKVHLNHLDKLRNLNIYNKIFQISCDQYNKYATINGFRLGYKVIWPEVNAALGQIVLLLIFVIKRLSLKLKDYQLIPMGSQSQIAKFSIVHQEGEDATTRRVKTKTILNLYTSNEFSLGKLFNFNKLDVSMIALLEIVEQIELKLRTIDDEMELPYKIVASNGAIGGKSIRVTSNSEWTHSCKFLLTNLSWILSYTSVHTSSNGI